MYDYMNVSVGIISFISSVYILRHDKLIKSEFSAE